MDTSHLTNAARSKNGYIIIANIGSIVNFSENNMEKTNELKNAAAILGKLGGQAGKGKPKSRPEGYYSRIAKLPRKKKNNKNI